MASIPKEVFEHIRHIQIRTSLMVEDILAGAYHSAFKGRGMEFEEVREYQPGDEVRYIDWNVTARMENAYVKNFREERELTVMLLIDVSASSRFGSGNKLKSDFIAEIAAVIAFSAIKNSDKVGLILFSDIIEKYIPPKKEVDHVLRVIRELLVFKPKQIKTDIGQALTFLGKVRKRPCVCFLISDLISPTLNIEQPVRLISKRHDLTAICVTDPLEMTFPKIDLVQVRDLETGEMALIDSSSIGVQEGFPLKSKESMIALKHTMNKYGAGFMQIMTNESYSIALQKYFKIKKRLG